LVAGIQQHQVQRLLPAQERIARKCQVQKLPNSGTGHRNGRVRAAPGKEESGQNHQVSGFIPDD